MITNPECGVCDDRGCDECLPPVSTRKWTIGAVSFAQECPAADNSAGFKLTSIMGPERVALLRRARDGVALPAGLMLVASPNGTGWRRITRDDVDWEGAGL